MLKIVKSSVVAAVILLSSSTGWAASTITRTALFACDAQGVLNQEVVEPDTSALRLQTDYSSESGRRRHVRETRRFDDSLMT